MIVKKMVFKNFMAYYDEVVFDFPVSEHKNVTIIYAPNDVGKTCFFKGFMFGLYGPERGTDISELINRNAFNEQKYEAYVSIEAEHQGNNISITRTIKPKGITGKEVTAQHLEQKLRVWLNGEEPFDNTQETIDFINSIVHKDAAKYFFFDGEKTEKKLTLIILLQEPIIRRPFFGYSELKKLKTPLKTLETWKRNTKTSGIIYLVRKPREIN
jgi:DNA sulfur modification protein DndD